MKQNRYFFLLLSLVMIGAGCAKSPDSTKSTQKTLKNDAKSPASQVWLPPAPKPETEDERNLKTLRAAIAAFQKVKSFRSDLRSERQDGVTSGKLSVMKPDRFHGTITITKDNLTSEAIGVGSDLYIRIPGGPWQKITSEAMSKAVLESFQSAVDGDQALIQSKLPDGTKVTKRVDPKRGCEHYAATIEGPDKSQLSLDVCVANGLPEIVLLKQGTDSVTIEYSDYNAVFTIERPTR